MIYLVEKKAWKMYGVYDNFFDAKAYIEKNKLNLDNFFVLTEFGVKYVNRITYVDGQCVYNNKKFWTGDLSDLFNNYEKHSVKSFLDDSPIKGPEVITKERFISEYNNMMNKLNNIDGRPGQMAFNIMVGDEFISLFREECILTEFTTVSPLQISDKLDPVISKVKTGSFREAKYKIKELMAQDGFMDEFLTAKRLQKYMDMLDAADIIEYATSEDFYYKV